MSSLAHKSVVIEEQVNQNIQGLKPFALKSDRVQSGDQFSSRVANVVALELANGSMPA